MRDIDDNELFGIAVEMKMTAILNVLDITDVAVLMQLTPDSAQSVASIYRQVVSLDEQVICLACMVFQSQAACYMAFLHFYEIEKRPIPDKTILRILHAFFTEGEVPTKVDENGLKYMQKQVENHPLMTPDLRNSPYQPDILRYFCLYKDRPPFSKEPDHTKQSNRSVKRAWRN